MKARNKVLLATGVLCVLSIVAMSLAMADYRLRWRLEFVAMKLTGRVSYMSWREVADVLRGSETRVPQPGALATKPPSEQTASASDSTIQRGRELFQHQCSPCHGVEARGGSGPDLTLGQFQHGETDSALVETITRGLRGTPMQPRDLAREDVLQIIAFLRSAIAANSAKQTTRLAAATPFAVGFEKLASARSDSAGWLMYSGAYDGHRHSRLSEINRTNVSRLHVKWMYQLPRYSIHSSQATPLVVGDAMFVTLPPNHVWCLDARTGRLIWSWSGPEPKVIRASNVANRGLAISGNTLYLGTTDAHLIALNAQTGALLWDVPVAEAKDGYAMTGAPLVVRDKVIVGVAGGEFAIRGFLDAYSTETGKRLWRTYTIPAPGEPGHETWGTGEVWRHGGGPTWLTGSYDPGLDLIYWGVGNPAPGFLGDVRPGPNLYTNSVIAVEPATGRMRWHFQFTPHDTHDWDACQIPVLADALFEGRPRKLLLWANRNAFYYVLDRETGKFLGAKEFSEQTWAFGIDANGAPIERPGNAPTTQGTLSTPSVHGATNWWSPSYDSASQTMYVPTMSGGGIFIKGPPVASRDGSFRGSAGGDDQSEPLRTAIRALEATTGALRWEYRFPPRGTAPVMGGVLSTDGGLVFAGDQTRFVGIDATTGRELWHFLVGGDINAAPITFSSEGRQQVTLAAGRVIVTFSLDGR